MALKQSLLHLVLFCTDFGRLLNKRAPLKGREWNRRLAYLPDLSGLMKIDFLFREVIGDWTLIRSSASTWLVQDMGMFWTLFSIIDHRYTIWYLSFVFVKSRILVLLAMTSNLCLDGPLCIWHMIVGAPLIFV